MNARVDPASLPAVLADDADLIAACKRALAALEEESALASKWHDLDERYYETLPPYPWLEQVIRRPQGPLYSSADLRRMLSEYDGDLPPFFREQMRLQITAVVAWERRCRRLRKTLGVAKARRRCDRAHDVVRSRIGALHGLRARTAEGAGFKAMVCTFYLRASGPCEGLGDDIADAVIGDVRRLIIPGLAA